MIAINTIAFSVIISQFLVGNYWDTQISDSTVINVFGR